MSKRISGGSPPAERVAHKRRAIKFEFFVKPVQKINQRADAIIDHRLVRATKAYLVGHYDSVLLRERPDGLRPVRHIAAQPMKQDNSRAAACFLIMNLHAVNRNGFIRDG